MKKLFTKLTMLLIAITLSTSLIAQTSTPPSNYATSTGLSGDPYFISSLNNLYWLSQTSGDWDKYFEQTTDIDASTTSSWDGGAGFSPIGNITTAFTGSYDGQNHEISNLYINRPTADNIGFFGRTGGSGLIQNLGLKDVTITGDDYVGGLIGRSQINVSNCYISDGNITGTGGYTGGFIGSSWMFVELLNCYSTATVSGNILVGGFAGLLNGSTTNRCFATGNVSGESSVGGFAGQLDAEELGMSISNCYAKGDVTRTGGTAATFGGFGGYLTCTWGDMGEILKIENCYSTGTVDCDGATDKGFAGGTDGVDDWKSYISNFFDSETSGQLSDAVGSATPKNTTQMKNQSTFTGWDFSTIWQISSGINDGYPHLQSNSPPVSDYYYRSSADGDWENSIIWEVSTDQVSWSATTETPTANNSVGITVMNDVTVDANVTIDQTTVNSGKTLTINSDKTLTINDGDGTDLSSEGTLDINGTLSIGTGLVDSDGSFDATGGNVTFTDAGNLKLGGAVTSLGTFTKSASTITYDGADQTILALDYSTLAISSATNGATKTFTDGTTKVDNEIEIVAADVNTSITLTGSSRDNVTVQVTEPGITGSRVFYIDASGKTINISNMTIRGGNISGVPDDGACIYVNAGVANFENVNVFDGKARHGSGILVGAFSVRVVLENCTVSNNSGENSASRGGGISVYAGTLSINNSTISNNTALIDGGGIAVEATAGSVTITNCTFENNTAGNRAGGIGGDESTVIDISNSTIHGNTASNVAGGVGSLGTLTLKNVSIANNSSNISVGGGLFFQGTSLTCINTIIANNINNDYYYLGGTLTDNGYNVVENSNVAANVTGGFHNATSILYNTKYNDASITETSWTQGGGDPLTNQDLNLSTTLADNGTTNGTQTLALNAGSFAAASATTSIPYGNSPFWNGSPIADQRGVARTANHNTSIGAFSNLLYEYRTIANGNWNEVSSGAEVWERSLVGLDTWETVTNADDLPDYEDESITVKNDVTVTTDITIDQTTVNSSNTLTVSSGVTLTIENNLTIGSEAGLTINSDAANNGSLIVSGTSTGNITYNRYMTGVDSWHLISSPVGGQDIYDFVVTDVATNAVATNGENYGLAPYNNITPDWEHYTTSTIGSAGDFIAGKGYEILRTSDGTVSFTGTVATSAVNIGITSPSAGNPWNLVGNPYPSALCANNDATTATTATENLVYQNSNVLGTGAYQAIYVWDANASTPAYITVNHSLAATYIAPGQSFFVNSLNESGSSFQFTQAMQTHQTGDIFRSVTNDNITIKLIAERSEGTSSTNIKYFENTTTGLDPGYDAGRFNAGNNSFAVYTHLVESNQSSVNFDIQCLPANEFDQIIPVGLNSPENTEVVFHTEIENLPTGMLIYLEDRLTGEYTPLHETGNSYSVQLIEPSQGIGRFYLHTQSTTTGIPTDTKPEFAIIPRPQYNSIRIIGKVDNNTQVAMYDITGRLLSISKLINPETNDINMTGLNNGVYIIAIISATQRTSIKMSWVKYR